VVDRLTRQSAQAAHAAGPLADRLRLCRSVAANPHIVVTDFEADLPSPYTASTLAFLRGRSPLVHFVWIMGADNLAQFHHWARWREIFTMIPIVVVDRPGWRLKALASRAARAFAKSRKPETDAALIADMPPPAWTFLTGRLSNASSTAIRNRAKAQARQLVKKAPARESLPWRKAKSVGRRPEPAVEAAARPKSLLNGAGS
jgi:nicotinate-nucleotide adenylyltransferase